MSVTTKTLHIFSANISRFTVYSVDHNAKNGDTLCCCSFQQPFTTIPLSLCELSTLLIPSLENVLTFMAKIVWDDDEMKELYLLCAAESVKQFMAYYRANFSCTPSA